MMCYKDRTWCAAAGKKCSNTQCYRYLTDKERQNAEKWWGSDDVPISYADFYEDCDIKIPKEDSSEDC